MLYGCLLMCGYCLFSWFVDVSCHIRSLLRGTRYAKHLFLGSQRIPSLKLEKPIKIDHPNSKKVFQSSIFRCYVFFSGRVTRISQIPFCVANYETIYIYVYTHLVGGVKSLKSMKISQIGSFPPKLRVNVPKTL